MQRHLVITSTGPDRPGLLRRVTEVLVAHGANLEESRMAQLGGEFAAIMLVSAPEERVGALNDDLADLEEREGLKVVVKPTSRGPGPYQGYLPYQVVLSGADHQGIVHAVADFLAGQGINIESLDTDVVNAPVTGAALFSMRAVVQAPPAISFRVLKARLAEIADRLGVDIDVRFP